MPGIEELFQQLPAGHPQQSELLFSARLPLTSSVLKLFRKTKLVLCHLKRTPREHPVLGKEGAWLRTGATTVAKTKKQQRKK